MKRKYILKKRVVCVPTCFRKKGGAFCEYIKHMNESKKDMELWNEWHS